MAFLYNYNVDVFLKEDAMSYYLLGVCMTDRLYSCHKQIKLQIYFF